MTSRAKFFLLSFLVVIAIFGFFVWFQGTPVRSFPLDSNVRSNTVDRVEVDDQPVDIDASNHLSSAAKDLRTDDERLSDALQDALTNESLEDAIALAERALLSTNDEIRAEALNVLGWFGDATMPEVTSFLSDRSESIRNDALLLWKDGLGHIEDENKRASIITSTCGALRDRETLVDVAMELVDLDSQVAVESLCSLMSESGSMKEAAAKEVYRFLTGQEYTDREDALSWASHEEDDD